MNKEQEIERILKDNRHRWLSAKDIAGIVKCDASIIYSHIKFLEEHYGKDCPVDTLLRLSKKTGRLVKHFKWIG